MAPSRRLLTGGTTALLALTLAACSPPNERDSNLKVATATGVTAPSATATGTTTVVAVAPDSPGYIDCVAAPVKLPTEISLNCLDGSDGLSAIEWESWGLESATGTATRADRGETTVEFSEPTESPQGLVFTRVTVDGETINL